MNSLRLIWLPMINRIRQEGKRGYFLRIGPLSVLNILVLSSLYSTIGGKSFDFGNLAGQYGYFVPMVALSVAVATWEAELLAGVGEGYGLYPRLALPTRIAAALPEVAVISIAFGALLLGTDRPAVGADLFTLALMAAAYLVFGTGLGFVIGFRHEKSVNNFATVIVWVLGLGPGPFLGDQVRWWQTVFPGSLSVAGRYELEWLRCLIVALLGVFLLWAGGRPRRHPFFSK